MENRTITMADGSTITLGKPAHDTLRGLDGLATAYIMRLTSADQIVLEFNDSTGRPCQHLADVTTVKQAQAKKPARK